MYRVGCKACSKSSIRLALQLSCGFSSRTQGLSPKANYEADKRSALTDSARSKKFHERLLQWDENLPTARPPSLSSLLEFLVRRRVPSDASNFKRGWESLVVRCLSYFTGLWGSHERMVEEHGVDPIHGCWYAPANKGDTFGIRHDEIYFHQEIIPSQPVTSYAVVIRGSPQYPGSAVPGGIAERDMTTKVASDLVVRDEAMIGRAASLILGLLKTREFYLSQEFKQEVIKNTPLSMQWYSYIFSCSMQFYPGCIERYKADSVSSRHVIVMLAGDMYKMEVLSNDDTAIDLNQLKHQLRRILKLQAERRSGLPVGVLTSLSPSQRCQEEQKLKALSEENLENLSLIRNALFVVCLEKDDAPRSVNEAMYALQSKNFTNRWYDKSVQLVVFRNGVAGFVNNYLAGMTGTVGTNFIRMAVGSEDGFQDDEAGTHAVDDRELTEPETLTWVDTSEGYFHRKLHEFVRTAHSSGPFKPMAEDVARICQGVNFAALCRSHRVTPGGTFQAALQLALARVAGRPMSVGEVVGLRHFRFGGMTFMDASMADMKAFVKLAMQSSSLATLSAEMRGNLRRLLIQAIQGYREEVLRHKNGEIHSWHLDSLYRNLDLPNRLPYWVPPRLDMKTRLRGAAISAMRHPLTNIFPPAVPENVTSNPDWYPEIEAIGRPGVKCILPPGSMAFHYTLGNSGISITANAGLGHPCYQKESLLVKELGACVQFVLELLEDSNYETA